MFIDRVKNGVECIEQIEKQPTDYYSLILMKYADDVVRPHLQKGMTA